MSEKKYFIPNQYGEAVRVTEEEYNKWVKTQEGKEHLVNKKEAPVFTSKGSNGQGSNNQRDYNTKGARKAVVEEENDNGERD